MAGKKTNFNIFTETLAKNSNKHRRFDPNTSEKNHFYEMNGDVGMAGYI